MEREIGMTKGSGWRDGTMHEKEGDGTVEQRTWQRGEEPGFIDIFTNG